MSEQKVTGDRAPDDDDDASADAEEQFEALLEGLRTTLPGIQVLFAFLLTLPFTTAFSKLDGDQRAAYDIAFYAAAVASVLLIAPSAHQRVRAVKSGIVIRRHISHVLVAARLTLVGTVVFLVALAAAVYLVATFVFEDARAAIATALIVLLALWTWFLMPMIGFRGDPTRPTGD